MARPLRIEYPGAWYHTMNRGRHTENIFQSRRDYSGFLDLLIECLDLWNVRIAAYCLMPNNYQLLLQTPEANLSRFMRHLNGVYTQRFNRNHQLDGQLFRGRYKAILIDSGSYLLQVIRYIHRNPLRDCIIDRLDGYEWSSHKGYISTARKWNWLYKDLALSMLGTDWKIQRRAYNEFMSEDDSEEIVGFFERKKLPWIIGNQVFIDSIRERFFKDKMDREIPESRLLAPDSTMIRQVICRAYGVEEKKLLQPVRGRENEPRDIAIYLTKRLCRKSHSEICKDYGLNNHSSVSTAIERVKERIRKDPGFIKRLERVNQSLANRQPKI